MCPNCRAFISSSDRVCPYCDMRLGPRVIDKRNPGDLLGGLIPHARFTTVIILTLNFGLYAATMLYSMRHGNTDIMDVDGRTLLLFGAKAPAYIFAGQWWRLITAGFLHGGLFHILMNSWVLFDLGAQVEEVFGSSRLVVIYLVSSVFGFVASSFWSPALSIGASAGLFGLIGAMIALGTRYRSGVGSAIRGLYIRWAVYGILFGLLPFFAIDNAAHIGGLVAGFLTGYVAGVPRPAMGWLEQTWNLAAGGAIALTVLAFLRWFWWFSKVSGI